MAEDKLMFSHILFLLLLIHYILEEFLVFQAFGFLKVRIYLNVLNYYIKKHLHQDPEMFQNQLPYLLPQHPEKLITISKRITII